MMLAIILCLIGVSVAANEETTTSSGPEASGPGLATGTCVPTAVVRGPCHQCVCQDDGMFLCTGQEKCTEKNKSEIKGPECIPDMIFRDGILWCSCTNSGEWRSKNCRLNFKYLRSKTVLSSQFSYSNLTCDSENSYYSVDCNICLCKNGKFEPASCTNRTCLKGNKADSCKPGQVLRTENQLCACSQIGYYVDKLCVFTVKDSAVHKLTLKDLETLTHEENQLYLREQREKKCVPNTIIHKGCNVCRCSDTGLLTCTQKLCSDENPSFNISNIPRMPLASSNLDKLPEIKSLEDKCVPGQTYRYRCNKCICTKKEIPSCTNMLCLEDYVDPKMKTPTRSKDNHLTGKKKTNKVYDDDDAPDKNNRHKKSNKKNKQKESDDDYLLDNTQSDDDDASDQTQRSYDEYPLLPKKKCSPGVVYSKSEKSCQRCFCNEKRQAMCTDRPCRDLKGPVEIPEDVYPSIEYAKIDTLPSLPHEAAPCKKGRLYSVDCNPCLCLANGNLLCGNLMCLSISEANKFSALEFSGKPCKKEDPNPADCINCECQKGKFNCEPLPDCTSYKKFLRYLDDGDEGSNNKKSKVKPSYHLKRNSSCIPGMIYRVKCNRCFCQEDGSLRCTRKGCLNFVQTKKLKKQRLKLLALNGNRKKKPDKED